MTTARRVHHSYEQYLRTLEMSDVKLEYFDGEIYAMAGGTPTHARLAAVMTRLLDSALRSRCSTYSSDLRVFVEATGLATFPDVTVVCGETDVCRDRSARRDEPERARRSHEQID